MASTFLGETPPSRTSWVVDRLRRAILTGELAPGERLIPAQLTERLGVSPTPLREAISSLASEGLVVTNTHRSAEVAPLSIRELREIYDLGITLVSLALRRSLALADARWRKDLDAAYEDLKRELTEAADHVDVIAHEQAHRRFNLVLRARCDSAWLLRVINLLTDHGSRYRAQAWRELPPPNLDDYRRLYEAAIAGDVDATTAASAKELTAVCAAIERALRGQGYDDEGAPPLAALSSLAGGC